MKRAVLTLLCLLPLALTDCGRVPKATTTRDSGQSGLMDETFAGKNACNPDNAERPFIIEWDATDMSSFESYAANDVVIVKYEGCNLKVLDECRNDSIRGSQGAYKPVEWTTGSLEKIRIANQGELYAKLPLGAATLGGRVAGGEKFSMEYYVAGTRSATRDSVYSDDIAANPGCEGATHFVYGYNLGAFALGSVKDFSAEAGGSAYGFGVGGKTSSSSTADKKGGDLAVCKSDSATEVAGCKAPIRLSLRKIRGGADPGKAVMSAPDTDESLSAAGQINAKLATNDAAKAHYESAVTKQHARDGKGCLAEMDRHDQLEPNKQSTDPKSGYGKTRSLCLMLSGKCEAGKELIRKVAEYQSTQSKLTPEQIDIKVDGYMAEFCAGKLSPRDHVYQSYWQLGNDAWPATPKLCADNYATVTKQLSGLLAKNPADQTLASIKPEWLPLITMQCFARAGDCKQALGLFIEHQWKDTERSLQGMDEKSKLAKRDEVFLHYFAACKGKF